MMTFSDGISVDWGPTSVHFDLKQLQKVYSTGLVYVDETPLHSPALEALN